MSGAAALVAISLAVACTRGGSAPEPGSPASFVEIEPEDPAGPACPSGEVVLIDTAFDDLAMDEDHLYLLGQDRSVWRVDKASHERVKIAELERRALGLLAATSADLFFVVPDEAWHGPGRLFRLAKAGGDPVEVAALPSYPAQLIVDEGDALFVTFDSATRARSLTRLSLADGRQRHLVSDAYEFVVDDERVYWAGRDAIHVVPRGGGESQVIAQTPEFLHGLELHGDDLYWWDEESRMQLLRIPKAGGPAELVMAAPDDLYDEDATRVVGDHLYWITHGGKLWRAALGQAARPELLDQRGAYDRGDYPSLLAIDERTIYWQAGPDTDVRTSDQEPLGLYYYCL